MWACPWEWVGGVSLSDFTHTLLSPLNTTTQYVLLKDSNGF